MVIYHTRKCKKNILNKHKVCEMLLCFFSVLKILVEHVVSDLINWWRISTSNRRMTNPQMSKQCWRLDFGSIPKA